jgi:hypothetical protein
MPREQFIESGHRPTGAKIDHESRITFKTTAPMLTQTPFGVL